MQALVPPLVRGSGFRAAAAAVRSRRGLAQASARIAPLPHCPIASFTIERSEGPLLLAARDRAPGGAGAGGQPRGDAGTARQSRRHGISSWRSGSSLILALATWGLCASSRRSSGFRWRSCRDSRCSTSRSCCTRCCTISSSRSGIRVAERSLGLALCHPERHLRDSQFTRWHLDHHAELGSSEDDPKRHHLSPKINARWYKLLYATPALFPIYFRAARRETVTYPPDLQRTIGWERRGLDSVSSGRDRAPLVGVRTAGGAARARHSGLLRLSGRVHAEPARPALRHRSQRSGEVGHADARKLVLELRVPELELPPRAPLLSGRAVLSAAGPAA